MPTAKQNAHSKLKRSRTDHSPEPDDSLQVASDHEVQVADDLEKEQNVWEGVRDEHFEAIEQVPLTLHRQCALVSELDQQVVDLKTKIPSLIMKYYEQRRNLSHRHVPLSAEANENRSTLSQDFALSEGPSKTSHSTVSTPTKTTRASPESAQPGATSPRFKNGTSTLPRIPTPAGAPLSPVNPGTTTRQLLSHIAWLVEKLPRLAEEKHNVAQAVYDTVDRHCRILQQAIKDQEASITLGARPGHLEPGNLSDLTVGRWVKPSRGTLSPIDGEDLVAGDQEDDMAQDLQEEIAPVPGPGKKGRGRPKGARLKSDEVQTQGAPPLTITLPAQAGATVSETPEETYCYCKQGSFGEMIACDNKKCPIEWYHVGCVGLQTTPEGMKTWYCPDCRPARRGPKRK
ncbi:putative germ-line stem cell division [Lyophyllum shimeji]|uniref:Chromatin modification-related protein n=1 Tax=Lyophyllum shimeji TaxID=47721 RepID=A0A9P3UJ21_LYOSH|nr:putative germ-line stem cell division [Lyophyllum shimeji]